MMGAQNKLYCSPDFRTCHSLALPSLRQPRGPRVQRGTVNTLFCIATVALSSWL